MKITACRCRREATPSSVCGIVIWLILLACHMLSGEGVCRAEDPNEDPNKARYVSIPLALSVGDDKVLAEAFLKCRVRRYSISVAEFMQTAKDPEEKAMCKLFRFIDGGQESLLNDLLGADADQKTRKTALMVRKMVEEFLPVTTVISMVHIGQYRLFIIGVADPRSNFVRKGDKEGRYYFFLGRRGDGWRWILGKNKSTWAKTLINVIWDSYVHAMRTGKTFSKCRKDLRFEYALPSITEGSPVYFQFNGRKVNVDVFADDCTVPENDPVMQFYVKAWQAFKDGHTELFLAYWDQESRDRLAKAMDMMPHFYDYIIKRGPACLVRYGGGTRLGSLHQS